MTPNQVRPWPSLAEPSTPDRADPRSMSLDQKYCRLKPSDSRTKTHACFFLIHWALGRLLNNNSYLIENRSWLYIIVSWELKKKIAVPTDFLSTPRFCLIHIGTVVFCLLTFLQMSNGQPGLKLPGQKSSCPISPNIKILGGWGICYLRFGWY